MGRSRGSEKLLTTNITEVRGGRELDSATSPQVLSVGKEMKRGGVGKHGYKKIGARVIESPMGNQTAIFLKFNKGLGNFRNKIHRETNQRFLDLLGALGKFCFLELYPFIPLW